MSKVAEKVTNEDLNFREADAKGLQGIVKSGTIGRIVTESEAKSSRADTVDTKMVRAKNGREFEIEIM